jgi:hypothetical protein
MYILYLDESGELKNAAETHFVLGGMAVFERRVYYLAGEVERVHNAHLPGAAPPVELHAADIRTGRNRWRALARPERDSLLSDIYEVIGNASRPGVVAFAVVVNKQDQKGADEEVYDHALEEVCNRFDLFLARWASQQEEQRGLLVFDESRLEKRALALTNQYMTTGTKWGRLRRLTDVPYFASSSTTRMLQLADFVTYAVFRRYEYGDSKYLDIILPRFDEDSGTIYGLVHLSRGFASCLCPACMSRRASRPEPGA